MAQWGHFLGGPEGLVRIAQPAASGTYDFKVQALDKLPGGTSVAGRVTVKSVKVAGHKDSLIIDFGSDPSTGNARFLACVSMEGRVFPGRRKVGTLVTTIHTLPKCRFRCE
jgi:hypothetical protein